MDGPSSFFMDLSRIFEQLKREQFSSLNRSKFYYYIRSPRDARAQEIPIVAEKQLEIIELLSQQAGFKVSEPERDDQQNRRVLITINDEDLFFTEYNKFAGTPKRLEQSRRSKQEPVPYQSAPERVVVEARNYDAANGILNVGGKLIHITRQSNRKGKQIEPRQAKLMRLLFNPVNNLQAGIPMRRVLSVRPADFGSEERKLVKSYIAEINKKVYEVTDIKELIISNQFACMVDKNYL